MGGNHRGGGLDKGAARFPAKRHSRGGHHGGAGQLQNYYAQASHWTDQRPVRLRRTVLPDWTTRSKQHQRQGIPHCDVTNDVQQLCLPDTPTPLLYFSLLAKNFDISSRCVLAVLLRKSINRGVMSVLLHKHTVRGKCDNDRTYVLGMQQGLFHHLCWTAFTGLLG